jgi:hypothetical protein
MSSPLQEMKLLKPAMVLIVPGGWKHTAFQPACHSPRWPNISKYCGLVRGGAADAGPCRA